MKQEYRKNKALNNNEISYIDKIYEVDDNPLLNPENGKILGYKESDITNLSNYSKNITKDNLNKEKLLKQKDIILNSKEEHINKLSTEIKNLKSGKTLKEKDKIIANQKEIIEHKENALNYQRMIIEKLENKVNDLYEVIDKIKIIVTNLYRVLMKILGKNIKNHQDYNEYEFKSISKKINKDKDYYEL